jgi:hypothetical protein
MFLKGPVYEDALNNYKVAPTYMYAFHYYGDRSLWTFIGDPDAIIGGKKLAGCTLKYIK